MKEKWRIVPIRKKISYVVISLALLFALGIISRDYIYADSSPKGNLVSSNEISVRISGRSERLSIEKFENKKGETSFYLSKKGLLSRTSVKLSGFENNISVCEAPSGYICLEGEVGAHSKNVQILTYTGSQFLITPFFKDGEMTESLTTDVPNYAFGDYNNDGKTDLAVDQRNYDGDPLSESIREYYICLGNGFTFNRTEKITY